MKKVLFLIHNLGEGGAEKVLVNLVNNMDYERFDITVMSLFDVGVNKEYLSNKVHYIYCFKKMFRGNSHLMKLFSPKYLHDRFIKDHYDIEIAYLEGPCARIISGCSDESVKTVSWIHRQGDFSFFTISFRNFEECKTCYGKFDKIVTVSEDVKKSFSSVVPVSVPIEVCYNTNESRVIREKAAENIELSIIDPDKVTLIAVGKLLVSKGFDRIIRCVERLRLSGEKVQCLILGSGPEEKHLKEYIDDHHLEEDVFLLGYQDNPYKYVAKSDLFVCASYAEGFSTAATEALIVGTPVCTVDVSGMKEMLGEHNEYGIICDNDEEALYQAIKKLLNDRYLLLEYRSRAIKRGNSFSTESTVLAVENMFLGL